MAIRSGVIALVSVGILFGAQPTIAAAAPDTTITSGPMGSVSSTSAAFTFSSNEAPSTFQCKLDTAAFATCPASYTGLSQGSHTFQVRATSASGTDPTPASRTWTVDTVAPNTTITGGPSGNVGSTSATFTFSSSEAGGTFQCRLDAAAFASCPAGYTGLSQGSHTFEVRATDSAGNTDSTPASRTWTVDTVAPDTTITGGPSGSVSSTSAAFTFSSNEAGSTFQCRLDAAAFATCPASYTGLSQGSHTFEVRATDAAANTDATPASRTWTVDTVAPNTTITGGPTGSVSSTSATFTFSSNEAGATFQCALDGSAFASCPAGYTGLSQASHTFQVRATDSAGNTDATPASRTWTADTVAPDTTITDGPGNPDADATPTFSFSSTEAASAFQCQVDGGGFASCSAPHTLSAQSDGSHTFAVRAIDAAGNVDSSADAQTWTVDTVAPETTITGGVSGPTGDSTPTYTFDSDDGTAGFQCAVDAGAFSSCDSPHTLPAQADGPHTAAVRAVDAAGNVDPTPGSRAFTLDTGPPQTTIDTGPAPGSLTNDRTPAFGFSATEPGTFECSLDAGPFAPCATGAELASLADGEHAFAVRARDSTSNADASPAERTFTVDTRPPEARIDAAPKPKLKTRGKRATARFQLGADEDGATLECSLDDGAFTPCDGAASFTVKAKRGKGKRHSLDVRATDPAGNLDPTPAAFSFRAVRTG